MLLFTFWAVDADGRPPADAARPWGWPCPFEALRADDAGPFLTVVDEASDALVFAADAAEALDAFAVGVARRAGSAPVPLPPAADFARWACALVANEAAHEEVLELVDAWHCPDPDTYRAGRLSADVSEAVAEASRGRGDAEAGLALRDALAAALAL